jgi:hypothetical protein
MDVRASFAAMRDRFQFTVHQIIFSKHKRAWLGFLAIVGIALLVFIGASGRMSGMKGGADTGAVKPSSMPLPLGRSTSRAPHQNHRTWSQTRISGREQPGHCVRDVLYCEASIRVGN